MAGKDYDVAAAFQAIEYELINSFFRNMKKHKVDEVKEQKQWEMWQVKQLQELDLYKKRNAKKYGTKFTDINKTIAEMIRLSNEEGQMDQEAEILSAMEKGLKPQRAPEQMTAQFFRTNDRKLDTLINATVSDMEKAEVAVLRKAEDIYRKTIFNAAVYANTGAGTYEKAVDMATKDFMAAGLTCVEYKNGSKHTISDYADMAVRTANKRAYLQGEGTKRQEWGIHTVIVNKRLRACPHCMPFAGKVFIDDVWGGGTAADGDYPLLSEAVAAGLYHPRCKDSHTAYFPGISDKPKKYTREEVKEAEKAEEQERKADYAERQAEKYQRVADTRLDPENKRIYEARANEWRIIGKSNNSGQVMASLNSPGITNSDEVVEEFMHSIEISDDADVRDRVRNSVKHMPKEDLDMIRKQGLIVKRSKKASCFVRPRRQRGADGTLKYVIRINPDRNEPFSFAHECAHFGEKVNDLYSDPEFIAVLRNLKKNISNMLPGVVDGEYYVTAISDLFVEPYQGRTYIKDLGRSGPERPVTIKDLVEYISVGYEAFIGDPKLLESKDPVLYNYFKRRGLR